MTKREAQKLANQQKREKANRATFLARTSAMYRSLKKRAGDTMLAFTLDELRKLVQDTPACRYCWETLKLKTFSIDHKVPLARGGASTVYNLDVCCISCNKAKGTLTHHEFHELVTAMETWDPKARNDVIGRLKAGASVVRLRFLRK